MDVQDPPSTSSESHLSPSEVERYSRQLVLRNFGPPTQLNLRNSRILIVGLGGLGSPAALYLAGAGIGVIGLVDRPLDVVEKSNLHRQVVHTEARLGVNKVESARLAIQALNSSITIETHHEIVPGNAVDLVSKYDVVLDCTDNVMSRYMINDACAAAKVPLVQGAAIGMDGQLTVYCSGNDTPCYRCIFPLPLPPSCVGSCDSAGVLGPVPGTIGTLQALEAIKLVGKMKKTEVLARKLLLLDAAQMEFRVIKLRAKKDGCPACDEKPTIDVASFDYEQFAMGEEADASSGTNIDPGLRVTVEELAAIRKGGEKYLLIDVRPAEQFAMCHLEEAESYPLSTLESSPLLESLAAETARAIFICRRGNASQKALRLALDSGLTNCSDVVGGLQSWHHNVDSSFPLY